MGKDYVDILDMEIDDKEEDVTENTLLDNDINDNSILLLEMVRYSLIRKESED